MKTHCNFGWGMWVGAGRRAWKQAFLLCAVFALWTSSGRAQAPKLVEAIPGTVTIPGIPLPVLMLIFDAEMLPQQSIQWSGAGVDPTKFTYDWVSGETLAVYYSPALANGVTVSWMLNPTASLAGNFRDMDGTELPARQYSGSFTIGGGGPSNGCIQDTCLPSDPVDPETQNTFFFVSSSSHLLQTSTAAPADDPESPSMLFSSYFAPTGATVTGATVGVPSTPARSIVLTNLLQLGGLGGGLPLGRSASLMQIPNLDQLKRQWIYMTPFASTASLETAFPPGAYRLSVVGAGNPTLTVNLPTANSTSRPRFSNFDQAKTYIQAGPHDLRWDPFVNPAQMDGIQLEIYEVEESGELGCLVFVAPNQCVPIALVNTATGITVPSGVLTPSKTYSAQLTFTRYSVSGTPGGVSLAGGAARSYTTRMTINGATHPGGSARLLGIRVASGTPIVRVEATVGATVTLEKAPTPSGPWSVVSTMLAATSPFEWTLTAGSAADRAGFYRVR